jgi:ribosomal protein L12E/L44/L45/RPP1/RPP2
VADPSAFIAAAPTETAAADTKEEAKEAKKEESEEESDEDMGFGLFD